MNVIANLLVITAIAVAADPKPAPEGETIFFRPSGFAADGRPITDSQPEHPKVHIVVRDADTNSLTGCRINVIGSDGNYYQPPENRLTKYAMTGDWPAKGAWGNRKEKAPFRYIGRYFYSTGEATVTVPPGEIRIEIAKGFEYVPQSTTVSIRSSETRDVEFKLKRIGSLQKAGYYGGDTHLHFRRETDEDDQVIFDLLDAEDVRYGTPLGYNEPAGPYSGFMEKMDSPQFRRLGEESIQRRGHLSILSGQEYRSATYGHLNLYLRNHLVFPGQSFNANDWPVYGHVGAETQALGGMSIHAHGGYALEIYADAALQTVNAVELLQFGIYRGIGLDDWYHILNSGYRFPCVGASDFPACRFMSDCRTYAWVKTDSNAERRSDDRSQPPIADWMRANAAGQSFVTTGPLVQLTVDDRRPGETIELERAGRELKIHVSVQCEVAKIQNVDLIVNGKVAKQWRIPDEAQRGVVWAVDDSWKVNEPQWIALRAYSTTPGGLPDAESHTNPVFVYVAGKVPYRRESLDAWVDRIDKQIETNSKRTFKEKAQVLAYFQKARDVLLQIREKGGLSVGDVPAKLAMLGESAKTRHQSFAENTSRLDVSDDELREFLKPVPPKPAQEAIGTFETAPGFHVELVAAEPLVYDPVAGAFDEDGNLYVCEMRDYPYKPVDGVEPIGTVRLLRDTNGDGQFDESHVFADKLLWAAGVAPWKGGVFVAAPPDIWYMKDTDGDHKADVKRRVYSGFGTGNQQAMVNNLQFGMDHMIYGATAGNGGTIIATKDGSQTPITITGRDFRFDPVTEQFEAITGTVQFGNTFDDWGNRFVCSESQPLMHIVLSDHYLARNPFLPTPHAIHNIAPGPVPIYRVSPVERWRQIRSSRRIAKNERAATSPGASHHVIDAAAGVTVYRGNAYPKEYYGNVFVGDGQNNLVHRRVLTPDGLTFQSKRAEERTEFVRSSDIWFRPVNFLNAPDGTLYCLDMSREVLESIHIPLDVVKHLDLTSGRNYGRIYRIAPDQFSSPKAPKLSKATSDELVEHLANESGWWRDTAQRLIFERQDHSIAGRLQRMVETGARADTRILALWSLQGLGVLSANTVSSALSDTSAEVRIQALRLSEPFLRANSLDVKRLVELANDDNDRVQFQLAFSLGESASDDAGRTLAGMLIRGNSQAGGTKLSGPNQSWMRTAILSSAANHASTMIDEILAFVDRGRSTEPRDNQSASAMSDTLAQLSLIVGSRNRPNEVDRTLSAIALRRTELPAVVNRMELELARGIRKSGRVISLSPSNVQGSRLWQERLVESEALAMNADADVAQRAAAVEVMSLHHPHRAKDRLLELVDRNDAEPVHVASIRLLADGIDDAVAKKLVDRLANFTPGARQAAIEVLLSHEASALVLLDSASKGDVSLRDLEASRRELLVRHKNERIRVVAHQIFGESASSERRTIVQQYQPALALEGATEKGKLVFESNCSACHKLGGKGFAIGPNLASSPSREPSVLLNHILDPNQYVLPNYIQFVLIDKSGRSYTGIVATQTATSVTLKKEKDEQVTVLRGDIDELTSVHRSLMPEGFEKTITVSAMADLLAFLRAEIDSPANADPTATRDFGTLPGIVEPRR